MAYLRKLIYFQSSHFRSPSMNFEVFYFSCIALKSDTLSLFSKEEIEKLRKDLSAISKIEYVRFFQNNIDRLRGLAHLTPLQMKKKKNWYRSQKERRSLILALYHYYELSEIFLRELNDISLYNGRSYKRAVDQIGRAHV